MASMVKKSKDIRKLDTDVDKMRIRRKDSEDLKVKENVFDETTLKALYDLARKGVIESLGGSISTGKEANVFLAEGKDKNVALKIYRISSSTFNSMDEYISGDPRFSNIRHKKKDIIYAWTKKEYRNLMRARECGIATPRPIDTHKNILAMEFIGEGDKPYPLLKEVKINEQSAQMIFDTIIHYLEILYNEAKLVHGDLSEYNILLNPSTLEPYLIDMGQSVTLEHPSANDFLKRDIRNLARHFKKYGIQPDEEELLRIITEKQRNK
ncbi:MAG: RIO kinase 1 [Methanohalophilus sp.]|nr:MAG: RIO kinase 1 [Methanohalophilus sp. 2-GBenrich]RSD34234.1 MAG: RIO kinase 1 [Methanohalophilus sp.]